MLGKILLVGAGGFLGTIGRYLVYVALRPSPGQFPTATLLINIAGCLVAGIVAGTFERNPGALLFLSVGMLGGFTTFSAFGLESFALLRSGSAGLAAVNVLANVFLGVLAVWIGRSLAS